MANEEHLEKLNQGVLAWNAWRQKHPKIKINLNNAPLEGIDLRKADLSDAEFIMTSLNGADLRDANLSRAILIGAHLHEANLRHADLSEADLSDAVLCRATLIQADFRDTNLKRANLCGADLRYAHFREANLIEANLNGATLTDACLWESQRAGWSIQGIICEAAYWDKDRKERTLYSPGEFEKLHADQTKIILVVGFVNPLQVVTTYAHVENMV